MHHRVWEHLFQHRLHLTRAENIKRSHTPAIVGIDDFQIHLRAERVHVHALFARSEGDARVDVAAGNVSHVQVLTLLPGHAISDARKWVDVSERRRLAFDGLTRSAHAVRPLDVRLVFDAFKPRVVVLVHARIGETPVRPITNDVSRRRRIGQRIIGLV